MNVYLVMTQQLPERTFELVEATTIAEASSKGIVMLLVQTARERDSPS
jgi:hypothetical protein